MKQQEARINKAKKAIGAKLLKERTDKNIKYNEMKRFNGIHRDQCVAVENGGGYQIESVLKYIDAISYPDDKQKWIMNLDKVIDLIFEV